VPQFLFVKLVLCLILFLESLLSLPEGSKSGLLRRRFLVPGFRYHDHEEGSALLPTAL
jgi:hypothetical protein